MGGQAEEVEAEAEGEPDPRPYRMVIAAARRHLRNFDYWKKNGHFEMALVSLGQLEIEVGALRSIVKALLPVSRSTEDAGGKQ